MTDSATTPQPPTDPLQPQTEQPADQDAIAQTAQTTQPETAQTEQPETDTTKVDPPSVNPAAGQQKTGSPLKKQHRDPRGSYPDHFPLQLVFLDGTLKGLALDLGVATNELNMNQGANWLEGQEEGLRNSLNYRQVSPRDFSFQLEYYDINSSVIHLTENVHHLQEIDPTLGRPPMVMLIVGANAIEPLVCTNLRTQLLNPQAKRRGYHKGVVDVELKLMGGRDSEHALTKPLVATPLGDIRASQTELERQKQGTQQVASLLLAECLSQSDSDQLTQLIENEQLTDIQAIANLSPQAFVQAAIAGFFSPEILSNEVVLQKLVGSLAVSMAQSENGVSGQPAATQQAFVNALLTGDTSGLTDSLAAQALVTQADYQAILEAIATGNYSAILDQPTTAGNKLRNFGSCGLSMKAVDLAGVQQQGLEAATLQNINSFLQGADDSAIAEKFGVSPESVAVIKNAQPYQTKSDFINTFARISDSRAVTGFAAWGLFAPAPDPSPDPDADLDLSIN